MAAVRADRIRTAPWQLNPEASSATFDRQGTARPLEFRLQAAPRTSSHHAPRDDPHAFLGQFRYRATSVRPRCCQNSDPPNEPVPRLALLAAGALNSTLA